MRFSGVVSRRLLCGVLTLAFQWHLCFMRFSGVVSRRLLCGVLTLAFQWHLWGALPLALQGLACAVQ
jgi:hypothetical protein